MKDPSSRGIPRSKRSRPFARSLPVPLARAGDSLHRPLRGTPRIAPGSRSSAQQPQEAGRSEVKRSRADSSHGEPRTEPPSDEVPRSSGMPLRMGEDAEPSPGIETPPGAGEPSAPGVAASIRTASGAYAWAGCRCFWASTSAIWIAFRAAPFRSWSPHTQKFRAFSALSSSRMRPT